MKTSFSFKRRFTAPLLFGIAALVGCGHKDTIVGKWQGVMAQQTASYEFSPDGKETISVQTQGSAQRNIVVTGTYTVSGNSLTQTITNLTMENVPIPIPAAQAHSQTCLLTLAGDQLTMTNSKTGKTVTLTRVK